MQKWNILTDRAQWVDEKNGVICPVIMFTPRVMIIKMSEMTHFFLLMQKKNECVVDLKEFLPQIFAWGAYYTSCQKRLCKMKYGFVG